MLETVYIALPNSPELSVSTLSQIGSIPSWRSATKGVLGAALLQSLLPGLLGFTLFTARLAQVDQVGYSSQLFGFIGVNHPRASGLHKFWLAARQSVFKSLLTIPVLTIPRRPFAVEFAAFEAADPFQDTFCADFSE